MTNPVSINNKVAPWHIHALMTFAFILVATSFIVMDKIAGEMDSSILTLLRFCLATILFLPILKHSDFNVPTIRDVIRYSLLGLCQAVFFTTMFEALRYTSSINTATLYTAVPIVSAIIAFFLLKERLGTRKIIGLFCALVGALWVIMEGDINNLLNIRLNQGDAIFLISVFSMGIYAPLINYLHRDEPMLVMTFWTIVTGTIWLIFFTNIRVMMVDWATVPGHVYLGIAYLAIFATIVTFFITQFCSIRIGPTKMMAYIYLIPSFVLLMNWLIGEQVSSDIIIGVALTLVASFVLQWTRKGRNIVESTKSDQCLDS